MTTAPETEKIALTLQAGDKRGRIVAAEGGIVFLREEIGAVEGRFGARLLMTDGPVGAAMVCVAERVLGHDHEGRYGYRVVAPANALQVVARMAREDGRRRFRHALSLERLPTRRASRTVVQARKSSRTNIGFMAAAAVFAVIVGYELESRLFSFEAEIARVAAAGEVVKAEKGGRVVFLTDKPEVLAGEPVFGVRTSSGYELASAAPIAGMVSQVLVRAGEKVRPGQPVMIVAPPDAEPFVVANVRAADAVRVAQGVRARLRFADGTEETVRLDADDIQPIAEGGSASRILVRIDTERDLSAAIGQSVAVRFTEAPHKEPEAPAPESGTARSTELASAAPAAVRKAPIAPKSDRLP